MVEVHRQTEPQQVLVQGVVVLVLVLVVVVPELVLVLVLRGLGQSLLLLQ